MEYQYIFHQISITLSTLNTDLQSFGYEKSTDQGNIFGIIVALIVVFSVNYCKVIGND